MKMYMVVQCYLFTFRWIPRQSVNVISVYMYMAYCVAGYFQTKGLFISKSINEPLVKINAHESASLYHIWKKIL